MRTVRPSIAEIHLLFRAFSAPVLLLPSSWGVAPGCLVCALSGRTERNSASSTPNCLENSSCFGKCKWSAMAPWVHLNFRPTCLTRPTRPIGSTAPHRRGAANDAARERRSGALHRCSGVTRKNFWLYALCCRKSTTEGCRRLAGSAKISGKHIRCILGIAAVDGRGFAIIWVINRGQEDANIKCCT